MNREIKFRVWDKRLGTWADSDDFGIACVCPRHDYEGGQYMVSGPPDGGLDCYYPEEEDEYVEQQFTGLKDKNDKSIYEGDIIQLNNGRKYSVVWDTFFFDLKDYDDYTRENQFSAFYHLLPEEMEIIGNIVENPEYLNK